DALVRLRLDQEAIPALELRFEAAARVADAEHEIAQRRHEAARAGEGAERLFAGRSELLRRVPAEKAFVLLRRYRAARASREEVAMVVAGGQLIAGVVGRRVAAEVRGDDADVDVEHGGEVALGAGGTRIERAGRLIGDGARLVEAGRVGEAA